MPVGYGHRAGNPRRRFCRQHQFASRQPIKRLRYLGRAPVSVGKGVYQIVAVDTAFAPVPFFSRIAGINVMHEVDFDVIEYPDGVTAMLGVYLSPAFVTRLGDESKRLRQIMIEMAHELDVARRVKKQIDGWCQIVHVDEAIGQSAGAITRDNREITALDSAQMQLHQSFSAIFDQRSDRNHNSAISVGLLSG